ncbi:unnamed protein product [Phyllotreta striolata]|uniref:Uncharacterized protein n=1 Tax=Phyllotreta striolata TaxID=444603 RepID=A0A9N9XN58_PHYSR|nr:unnamed protein product [Phyllotreta striolata]
MRTVTSIKHPIQAFIRIIIDMTSRRRLSRLLLRLPPGCFPPYRILITRLVVENNRKARMNQKHSQTLYSSSSNDDDDDDYNDDDDWMGQERNHEINTSTPLRRITADDLKAVRLRKSGVADGAASRRTEEIGDLLDVLRKRFAVMHSSVMSDYGSTCDASSVSVGNTESGW